MVESSITYIYYTNTYIYIYIKEGKGGRGRGLGLLPSHGNPEDLGPISHPHSPHNAFSLPGVGAPEWSFCLPIF